MAPDRVPVAPLVPLLYVCENRVSDVPLGLLLNYGSVWLCRSCSFPTHSRNFIPQPIFTSLHLCFWVAEITTPSQTSDVHQWGPITKHTRTHTLHVDAQRDYKTRVDHIPAALCCVSLQHLITNICACVCYYSDSLQWAKTSFLHTCLITHFSLSPISCTAAGHMAKSCCGRSYATVERTDWLLPLSLLRQRKQGQLINGAQQAGRTGFYQVWTGII